MNYDHLGAGLLISVFAQETREMRREREVTQPLTTQVLQTSLISPVGAFPLKHRVRL